MMSAYPDQSELVQTLQGLMDRLSSPDLTVAEANDLRPRLFGLLETIDGMTSPNSHVDRNA